MFLPIFHIILVLHFNLFFSAYIRGVTEYVLNLALPSEDFSNPMFRSLAQDLLAEQVLLPTAHYVTTSFYFNSTVVSLVSGIVKWYSIYGR